MHFKLGIVDDLMINLKPFIWNFRGKIHYTDVFNMLRQIDPPLGFGKKCPERMAYKKLIRMNMPMDKEGKVSCNDFWNDFSFQKNSQSCQITKKISQLLTAIYMCANTAFAIMIRILWLDLSSIPMIGIGRPLRTN